MDKILTVSVAAYNTGNYLRQTLSSLDEPEILKSLEVFVIDDGGTDGSADIAREFEKKYPDTFHFIHKENGGYGTVVNWSVEHATGKYFKLLDGDDYFSPEGLARLIERMKRSSADAFISNVIELGRNGRKKELYSFTREKDGEILDIHEAVKHKIPVMWGYAFNTELLKKNFRPLPPHRIFTDQMYVIYGLTDVRNIEFVGEPVYYYRTGRDGQSISSESVKRHIREIMDSNLEMAGFYEELCRTKSRDDLIYINRRVCYYYYNSVLLFLRKLGKNRKTRELLKEYDLKIKGISPDIYCGSSGSRFDLYRKTDYWAWLIV